MPPDSPLAAETDASVIVIERNFGGDQAEPAVKGVWDGQDPAGRLGVVGPGSAVPGVRP